MKTVKIILVAAVSLVLVSCGNDQPVNQAVKPVPREHFIENIKKYEAEMHKSMEVNPSVADMAIKSYTDFATQFPEDSLSADFLFKAAEVSTANQQYPQALSLYQTIDAKYPKFKLAPESLYLQAYLLDNFLNDDVKAKPIYELVIARYPNLPYAQDAKAAIANLGKSDEELIKAFEKKNKGK